MEWILKGLKALFTIGSFDDIRLIWAQQKSQILSYFGSSMLGVFYVVAILFLFLKRKDLKDKLLIPLGILIFLFIFPQTFRFMRSYMFEGGVFWRYIWILQIHLIIAIAVVEIVHLKKRINYLSLLFLLACLLMTGTFIFTPKNFQKADNLYNIPEEVITICNIIKEDAGDQYLADDLVVAPAETAGWMRMYDADICVLYGRFAEYIYTHNDDTREIDEYLTHEIGDLNRVLEMIKENKCSYLVAYKSENLADINNWDEYVLLEETNSYVIYKIN